MLLGKAVRFLDLDRRSHTLYQSCMFHLLAGEDLHPSQLPILWAIAQTGAISQGQVARVLGVSRAAVAVSAKRMERAGLVIRGSVHYHQGGRAWQHPGSPGAGGAENSTSCSEGS